MSSRCDEHEPLFPRASDIIKAEPPNFHEHDPLLRKRSNGVKAEPLNPSDEVSFTGAVVVLFCTAAGAGLVVVPRALSFAGWAAGLLALTASALLSGLSLSCLFKCAEVEGGASSYQSLVQKYLPSCLSSFVEMAVALLLWGTIGTMLLLATHVWENVETAVGLPHLSQGQMALVLLVMAVALCLPRNFSQLEGLSVANMFASLGVVIIISIQSAQFLHAGQQSASPSAKLSAAGFSPSTSVSGFFAALPITLYSFFCQYQVPQLYSEMHPSNQCKAPLIGGIATAALHCSYALVGLLGYAAFGDNTESDILLQLSRLNPANRWLSLGHMLFGCVLLLSTPLLVAPLRGMILRRLMQDEDVSFGFHTCATVCIISSALLLALNVPGVDFIMGLLGATCVVFLALTVPGLLALKGCRGERKIEGWLLLSAGLICAPLTFGSFLGHHFGYLP